MSHGIATFNQNGNYPPEPKVLAATATTAIVSFVLDAISNAVQNQDSGVLLNGLPDWLEPFVAALLLAIPTFAAGWSAKHQHRRGPAAAPPTVA